MTNEETVVYRVCRRCGWRWLPRTSEKPRICPNRHCHSVRWDDQPATTVEGTPAALDGATLTTPA